MCASSHFKGINENIRIDILACIRNHDINIFNNGELSTGFTLTLPAHHMSLLDGAKILKVDLGYETLLLDAGNQITKKLAFNDCNIDTLICVLEHIEQHVEKAQLEARTNN